MHRVRIGTRQWFKLVSQTRPLRQTDLGPQDIELWLRARYQATLRDTDPPRHALEWEIEVSIPDPVLATEFVLRYA